MELTGSFVVARPRHEVWTALNDPEVLRLAIPGCDGLSVSDGGYDARVVLRIGPVKASFAGRVAIAEAVVGERLVLAGEGSGGVAGFAKGRTIVALSDSADGTEVAYVATVNIGGKLAQLGARLIASTARQLAGQFFSRLNQLLAKNEEPA